MLRSEVSLSSQKVDQPLNCSPQGVQTPQLGRTSPRVRVPLKPLDLCSAPVTTSGHFLPLHHSEESPLKPTCCTSRKPSWLALCRPLPVRPSRPRDSLVKPPSWAGLLRALWPPHPDPRPGLTAASTSRARPNLLVGGAVVALPLEQVTHQDAQQSHEAEDRHDGNNRILGSRLLRATCPGAIPRLPRVPSAGVPCCYLHATSGPPSLL